MYYVQSIKSLNHLIFKDLRRYEKLKNYGFKIIKTF